VATISAGDDEIGDVIAMRSTRSARRRRQRRGGQTFGMDLEFTEGMQFDKGYICLHGHRPGAHGGRARGSLISIANQKIARSVICCHPGAGIQSAGRC